MQVIDLVNHVDGVEFFIREPGTDLTNALPSFALTAPGISERAGFPLKEYEITIRDAATDAVLFGPQLFDLTIPGIYTLAAVDNADGATVDVVLLDDLQ
jgi:hypothetical protein